MPNKEYKSVSMEDFEEKTIITNMEIYYKEKIEEYLQEKLFYDEDGMKLNKFYYGQSCEHIYQDINYLSLLILEPSYTGGAHGYASFSALNINLSTGELVKLGDVFSGKYLEYLYEKLTKKYSFYKEYCSKESFLEWVNEDFFIDEKGLLFITNPFGWGILKNVRIDYSEIDEKYYNKKSDFYKYVIEPRLSDVKNYNKLPTFKGFIYE